MFTSYSSSRLSPLDDAALLRRAPSIFAGEAHEETSAQYRFFPTIRIVEGMRKAGWMPVAAEEARVRVEGRRGFQKHVIRFQQDFSEGGVTMEVGKLYSQVVISNSHDGKSAYHLDLGLFRLVCMNGLMIADSIAPRLAVPHRGATANDVVEASFEVVGHAPLAIEKAREYSRITVEQPVREAFAGAALLLKYDSLDEAPVRPDVMLRANRYQDEGNDLWKTFNTVQENLIRGGRKDHRKAASEGKTARRMKAVTSLDENARLNKALWHLTEKLGIALR